MSRAHRLANHIERTVTGPMWHGPALHDVLEGVTSGQARTRPLPGVHGACCKACYKVVVEYARHADTSPGLVMPGKLTAGHRGSEQATIALPTRIIGHALPCQLNPIPRSTA